MRTAVIGAATLLLTAAAVAETRIPAGEASGTWTKAASPYIVAGDIRIMRGQTLRIDPGVHVQFEGPFALTVFGKLQAGKYRIKNSDRAETDAQMVRFMAAPGNAAGWGGLRFVKSKDDCYLAGCTIEHARSPESGGGIYCENCELDVARSLIQGNSAVRGGGIAVVEDGDLDLSNVVIRGNSADDGGGIYIAGSEINLANTSIESNPGGGVAALTSEINFANCSIDGNTGASSGGVFARDSRVRLTNTSVSGNMPGGITGVAKSTLRITNSSIRANGEAAAGGGIRLDDSELELINSAVNSNVAVGIYARGQSSISLVNCSVQNVDRDAGSTLIQTNSRVGD